MTTQPPNPAEELALVDETRSRTARATTPPFWADATCAVMVGVAWVLVIMWRPVTLAMAALLLAGAFALAQRTTRRRGRVLDGRAVRAHMGHDAVFLAPVVIGGNLLRHTTSLALLVAFGVLVSVLVLAYLRIESRYDARRLATGDHEPWDLV